MKSRESPSAQPNPQPVPFFRNNTAPPGTAITSTCLCTLRACSAHLLWQCACILVSQVLVHLKAGTHGFFITSSRTHFFLENVLLLLLKQHPSNSDRRPRRKDILPLGTRFSAPKRVLQARRYGPESKHLSYCSLTAREPCGNLNSQLCCKDHF